MFEVIIGENMIKKISVKNILIRFSNVLWVKIVQVSLVFESRPILLYLYSMFWQSHSFSPLCKGKGGEEFENILKRGGWRISYRKGKDFWKEEEQLERGSLTLDNFNMRFSMHLQWSNFKIFSNHDWCQQSIYH